MGYPKVSLCSYRSTWGDSYVGVEEVSLEDLSIEFSVGRQICLFCATAALLYSLLFFPSVLILFSDMEVPR